MNKVEIVNTVVSKCLIMRGLNGSNAYDFGSSKVYHFALSRYSNNILTVSEIHKVKMDSPNLSKGKLYRMYVYDRLS